MKFQKKFVGQLSLGDKVLLSKVVDGKKEYIPHIVVGYNVLCEDSEFETAKIAFEDDYGVIKIEHWFTTEQIKVIVE